MTISAVILTKNEEDNIVDCIEKLSFCNEIIVIDDNSTDRTVEIAKNQGVKIIKHPLDNNFSQQRNFALTKAKCDWILFIDADERVSKQLKEEIIQTLSDNPSEKAYYIKREDFMWGKLLKHGETGNIYLLRLAKAHTGVWIGKVHESWVSESKAGELKNPIFHYPHVTISDFISEINFYSSIRAKELFDQKKKTNWFFITAYPKVKFIQNYIFRLGILDGIQGLMLAFFMSLHSFLVRGKLWLLWHKK